MPIYEYQCCECGNIIEAIQKISDAPLKDCPRCGKPALEKKLSASAFRLKGGGWYETDFKTGNKKNIAGSSEGSKDSGSSGSDSTAGKQSPAGSSDSSKNSNSPSGSGSTGN